MLNYHRGSKFEQILFSKNNVDTGNPIKITDDFLSKSVFVTTISTKTKKDFTVFYSAQIDGLDSNNENVEAKTKATNLKSSWIQCKLGMTDHLIYGDCDSDGYVTEIAKVSVDDLEINPDKIERYFEVFVARMERILEKAKRLGANQLLFIESTVDGIRFKFIEKTVNNQILNNDFKNYFKH
uniref:Decapping nuclease n=1 Tax=Panagrolaimus sp. JU765 TaxID=591449 RepID=A0AC34RP09_9BILA